jgi:hypothetical protein
MMLYMRFLLSLRNDKGLLLKRGAVWVPCKGHPLYSCEDWGEYV